MFLIIILILFFSPLSKGQQKDLDDNRIVAKAGGDKITAKEFKDRYDFSPHPRKSGWFDTSLVKKEYLYTLIAEKLLAQKAREKNLDSSREIKEILNYMNKMFVRDALYKLKISSRIKVNAEDISEAEKRYSKLLIVKYLYSENQEEINNLYKELNNGISIDSLLINRPEHDEQKPPRTVTFGTLEKNLEDSLFNLKSGEYSAPLKTGKRWYIFQLIRIMENPALEKNNFRAKLKKIIEDRQTEKLENDFLFSFLHNEKVEVDKSLFFQIVNAIKQRINRKEESSLSYILLGKEDFELIIDSLGNDIINQPFIKFQENPETVKEFLSELKYNSLKVDTSALSTIAISFNKYVKDYIQNELLVRAAYKQNIQNSPSVKNDMKLWEDYYLAQKLERIIYDSISVSENEAYKFYSQKMEQKPDSHEVKIGEILTDTLAKIEEALKEIDNGLSFEDAAKKYSIKEKRAEYISVPEGTELGRIIKSMKIGEVYGPIKNSGEFSLIKLFDRRKSEKPRDVSFNNIRDDVIEELKGIELRNRLKNLIGTLAVEYGVKINDNVFSSIAVNQINTLTVRMIGFGGRIYAFPYVPLFPDWYDIYKKKLERVSP